MSTRSTTHFCYETTEKTQAIIYRHSDGYPEGAGVDLRYFLKDCAELEDPRFTDPTYLAAKYTVWLSNMFSGSDNPLDFLGVGVCQSDPSDIEYRYHVVCCHGGVDAAPILLCYKRKGWNNPIWVPVEVPAI